MKQPNSFLLSLGAVICIAFNTALADSSQTNYILQIGLDETIKRVLDASEELKIKDSEVNKIQGIYREVRSGMLPHINAQSLWGYTIDSPTDMKLSDYYGLTGVNASQVIWSFGKIMYAVSSAKRTVEAGRFNREASRQEIIYTAKLSYYSTLLARNALSITEKSYTNAVENKKLLGQRSYSGRSSKYEILKMDTEIAVRVPTVNEARTQFDTATETLKKLINEESVCRVEITEDFKDEYEEFDYETLVIAMYEYEPSLKSFAKSIESAEAMVKSKYASFLPTVSAFISLDYFGGSRKNTFLEIRDLDQYAFTGVKIDIPIWEGGEKEAQLSQARADKEIAVLKKGQIEKNLLLDLKKAYLEYKQYKENLKANVEATRLTEEAFKQTQEMFASGQATLTDLNDAELLLTNQRLNKEMTLFNINITLAGIEKLIAEQYDEKNVNRKP